MGEWPTHKVAKMVRRLEAQYGRPTHQAPSDPLEELVSCILSQHTTDATSFPTYDRLREAYPDWIDMEAAGPAAIAQVILRAGLANQKARTIHRCLVSIRERFGSHTLKPLRDWGTQEARGFLESLPGVGPKTAAIVLCFALGREVVPVDTHVYRVAKRLGMVPPVGAAKAHPLLDQVCPRGLEFRLHMALIQHGRAVCKAERPRCPECLLRPQCQEAATMKSSKGIGYPLGARPASRGRKGNQDSTVQVLGGQDNREKIGKALGPHRHLGLQWLDSLADSGAIIDSLVTNEDRLHRFTTILESAPSLVVDLSASQSLTEALLDGNLLEPREAVAFRNDAPALELVDTLRRTVTEEAIRWVFDPSENLGRKLSDIYDRFLVSICGRLCLGIDLLALGSYGTRDLTLGSDLDVAILVRDSNRMGDVEAATLASLIDRVRQSGGPVRLDFGVDSLLRDLPGPAEVRTYDMLRQYELEQMDIAERFGLGNARLVWGDPEADNLLQKTAYAVPLTPERLRELVAAKRKYEAERVQVKHRNRDVKRGLGGLSDIEWLVHLYEMRYPTATHAGTTVDWDDRIANLASARLINTVEFDELLEAKRHLTEVRHRLILLGLTRDVVPENPDKLARLAHSFGYADGNDFLGYHERVTDRVRALYADALEQLKV